MYFFRVIFVPSCASALYCLATAVTLFLLGGVWNQAFLVGCSLVLAGLYLVIQVITIPAPPPK